jgi:integrase
MATISKYQNASGATLYRVRYRTPDNRQTDKRGFATKREAQDFANTIEVAKLRGEYVAASAGKTIIGELGSLWLARQQGHMKPSGYRSYDSAWRCDVKPRWAAVPIAAIRYSEVQSWVSELATRHSATTVQRAHSVLCRILDDALRDRLLAANPALKVKLPKRPPPRHVYLTRDQLDALATEAGRYRSLVLLLGVGGLRWGEAAALRPCDIDWLQCRISLTRNAVMVGGTVVMGTLKGNKNRTVVVPRFVIDALSATAAGKSREELLWATSFGTPLGPPANNTSWLAYAVKRCRQAADAARAKEASHGEEPTTPAFPRVTAHVLRHTAASLAIHSGANPKVVQQMLGHASAAMTLDVYADLFESDLDSVAENVGKMWARAAGSH